jgi:parallel beta-helix repeat protein
MHTTSVYLLIVGIILLSYITITTEDPLNAATGNTIYVDDSSYPKRDGTAEYPLKTIQDALDRAETGDTIYVFGGLYDMPLIINKQVTIVGSIEGGPSVIEILEDERYTIQITKDYVTFEAFTLQDTGQHKSSPIGALICIKASNVVVQGNYINDTKSWGIYIDPSSSGSVISGNMINNTNAGIYVDNSDTNDIFTNTITNSTDDGIYVTQSSNTRLYNNDISTSGQGINVQYSTATNITNNHIFDNIYAGVGLYGGKNTIIKGNLFETNDGTAIYLQTTSSQIKDNTFESNRRGINLDQSDCLIYNNTFANNTASGIFTSETSQNNQIYLNKFINNTNSAFDSGSNTWYVASQGNYWSDYDGIDLDRDGIGDTPYSTNEIYDPYPLGYFLKPPYKPSQPSPEDFETGVGLYITLDVYVEDPDTEKLTVEFYRASDDVLIKTVEKVPSESTAQCYFNQPFDTTFAWYAIADDGKQENRSDIWIFSTRIAPPDNEKPVADPAGPYSADKGEPVTFDGSGSYDNDGDIDFYRWNFGDGSSEILAMNPIHTYDKSGEYIVTLTVVDNNGRSDIKTTTVDISFESYNFPPIPDIGGPYTGVASEIIVFDASQSYDKDGTITNYIWQFGDGTTATGMNPTHTFTKSGAYAVNLTVEDDFGVAETTSIIVIVNEAQESTPGFNLVIILFSLVIISLIFRKKIQK